MKKILLTLGTAAAIAAPVATVVACGSNSANAKGVDDKAANAKMVKPEAQPTAEFGVPPKAYLAPIPTTVNEIPGFSQEKITETLDKAAKAVSNKLNAEAESGKNPFTNITEDGLYLWKKHYTGKVWNGDTASAGKESENEVERIGQPQGWALNPSVQLGNQKDSKDEDSIYMVYDDDDYDGISIDNFTDTVYFEDTSVTMEPSIYKVNEEVFGNVTAKTGFGSAEYVAFQEDKGKQGQGTINSYIGSQNNHVSSGHGYSTADDFDKKMKEFIAEYNDKQPQVVATLLKYYGQKLDSSGNLVDDPTILNHASRGFAPVYYTHPIFTYKKVFHNVIQITFHEVDGFQCTAAGFEIKQKDGGYKKYGSFSLGRNDWSSYWGHSEAKYVGYHPKTS